MISKKIVLHFPHNLVDQPTISRLVKKYELSFNILQAKITPDEEGLMIIEFSGKESDYYNGIKYLQKLGVGIQPLEKDVHRNEDRCTQCGVCTVVCPTGALSMNREDMTVSFDVSKCTGCELCVPACPVRAMEVKLI
ncbi:MAG: 4Fe-4S binding protein [Candidatus Omnitrophota bacterium]|nr:4Fe-4S binding protein [Candidatus Omnitrophota bacterium]